MVSYSPVGRSGSASVESDQQLQQAPTVGSSQGTSRPTGEFRQLQLFKKLIPQLDGSGAVPDHVPTSEKVLELGGQEVTKEEESNEKPQEANESTNIEKESDEKANSSSTKKESEEARKVRDSAPLVLRRGATGTVKWFSFVNGYGFINLDKEEGVNSEDCKPKLPEADKEEQEPQAIFVHASAIVTRTPRVNCVLMEGESVVFDIAEGLKGKEAIAVTGPGGTKAGQRKWSYKNRLRSQRAGRYADEKKKRNSCSEDEYASCHEEESQLAEKFSNKLQLKKGGGPHEGAKKRRASNGPSEGAKDKRVHASPNKESGGKADSGKLKAGKQLGRRSMQFSNKKATPALQKNFNQLPATN